MPVPILWCVHARAHAYTHTSTVTKKLKESDMRRGIVMILLYLSAKV